MRHSAESNSKIGYLRKYEFIFETGLAHESGDPGVLFSEKNWGLSISCYCPFKESLLFDYLVNEDAVLRIRDDYLGSGSDHFLVSRNPDPDPTVFYPGSRIRVLQIREG
jgi:hypothetical protein